MRRVLGSVAVGLGLAAACFIAAGVFLALAGNPAGQRGDDSEEASEESSSRSGWRRGRRLPPGEGPPPSTYRGVPRVEIPAIGVSAPIVRLGVNSDGKLEVPKDYAAVGVWSGGASPGERGPAVLAGHVDSKSGPAVFYRLRELKAGDVIRFVRRKGSTVTFTAERTEERAKDEFPTARVYGKTQNAALRLVTCSGPFERTSYRDNLIVFAHRVSH